MTKLVSYAPRGIPVGYSHRCPLCGHTHVVYTSPAAGLRGMPNALTGSLDAPSFRDEITAGDCRYTMTDGMVTPSGGVDQHPVPEWDAS